MRSSVRLPGWAWILPALVAPLLWFSPALISHRAPSFRDQGDFFYPLKLYTADRIAAGDVPLWNPLSGGGEPWLANLQSGVFYPPTWLFLIPSAALAGALFLLLHFALAAWGMRRFLLQEAVSEAGALFGSVVLCAGGLAASLSAYWNHFGGWAYLPGIVALARSGLTTRSARVGLAFLVGLQVMAGSPEMTAATLVAAALFAWSPRSRSEGQWSEATPARSAARFAIGALLGLVLAGWVLVPFGELLLHSDRRGALPTVDRESGAAGAAALTSALGLSLPDASYLSSIYIGPLSLFAAAAAFSEGQRRQLLARLTLLVVLGLLVAAAGPPGAWLRHIPPLDRIRYPSKALALAVFGLAALGGLGADALRFAVERGRKRRALVAGGAAAAVALFLLSPLPPSARWSGVLGVAALCALGLWSPGIRMAGLLEAVAALALAASLAFAGRSLFFFVDESEIRREPPEVISLSRLVGRVLIPPMRGLAFRAVAPGGFGSETMRRQRESLLGYTNLLFRISTVRTAAPLPTRGGKTISDVLDRAPDPVRASGAASARVLWTPFRPEKLPSHKIGDYYRAPIAPYRPRLSFVRAFRIERDPERAWQAAAGGEIDLTREVFLDREPRTRIASDASKHLLVARLAEDRPEKVVADVTSNEAGLLVLTDLAYPGWSAESDGRKVEILDADGFFRAVALPAGSHRVVFRYRPISVYVGAGLSLAAAVFLLASLFSGGRNVAPSLW